MTRRLVVLLLALAALAPARPAVAACTTQKDHHCACTVQMTSATCCCTGKEIPAKAQGESPQVQQADPGLIAASLETAPACAIVPLEHLSHAGRPVSASPTPIILLTGTFLS